MNGTPGLSHPTERTPGTVPRHRWLAAFCLLLGLVALVSGIFWFRFFIHDDAYIALRYARNLIHGHGLTWNPGQWVEGYTSFLMVMLVSALGALGLDLVAATRIVNFAAVGVMVLDLYRFLLRRTRSGSALAVAIPLMLLCATSGLPCWAWGGLEGPLFACVVTIAATRVIALLEMPEMSPGRASSAGVALGAVMLTRPDGAIFAGLAVLFVLVSALRRETSGLGGLLSFVAPLGLIVGTHLLWRHAVYGAWIPNSVTAKSVGLPPGAWRDGLRYLADFVTSSPMLPLLAAGFCVAGARFARLRWSQWFGIACCLVYAAAVASVGGGYMREFRLLLPLLPLLALLLHFSLDDILPRASRLGFAALWLLPLLAVAFHVVQGFAKHHDRVALDPAAFGGTSVARHIQARWPEGTTIALNTAGSTPYYADRYRYIDMLGLNDAHIGKREVSQPRLRKQGLAGHVKGDGRYVLGLRPEIIILGPSFGSTADEPWFLSDLEIVEAPEFHRWYGMRQESIDVRDMWGYRQFMPGGSMKFTYYERLPLPHPHAGDTEAIK